MLMDKKFQIIFASHNAHKLSEINKMLDLPWLEILSLKDLDFNDEIEETGETLEENALIKSKTIFDKFGKPVFSDDSGLEVLALDMAPGVYSARYAGTQRSDEDNMDKLLNALESHSDRRARFRAVFALIIDGKAEMLEGVVNGRIGEQKKGNNGFGYDPIFIPENYDRTFAELTDEEKNKLSHRFRAVQQLKSKLEEIKKDLH